MKLNSLSYFVYSTTWDSKNNCAINKGLILPAWGEKKLVAIRFKKNSYLHLSSIMVDK